MEEQLVLMRRMDAIRAAEADAAARAASGSALQGQSPERVVYVATQAAAATGAVLRQLWGLNK